MEVLLTIINDWQSSTFVRKSSILNFALSFRSTLSTILTIIENKPTKASISNSTRENQKIVLTVNYAVSFITSQDKLMQFIMNQIIELYNNCFDTLFLGKQDSISQGRFLDDYCEFIEHDVQQESQYISCVRPISFSQLMLRDFPTVSW